MNGLLTPSAVRADGMNLVLWSWGGVAPVRVRAQDPQEDLPRDQSSWPRGQHRCGSPHGRGHTIDGGNHRFTPWQIGAVM
jgi:hypothetical protein